MRFQIVSVIVFLLIGCQKEKQKEPISEATSHGVDDKSVAIRSRALREVVTRYYEENLAGYGGVGVVTLTLTKGGDTSSFIVSSKLSDSSIAMNPPSFYSAIDGIPVLVYTGVEKDIVLDSLYIKSLQEFVEPYLEKSTIDSLGNIVSAPRSYNPVFWKIDLVHEQIVYKDY